MSPVAEPTPTEEERRDAEALAQFLAGRGEPPTLEDGETVGLLLSTTGTGAHESADPGAHPIPVGGKGVRAAGRFRPRDARMLPGLLAAAAVLVFFLWPQETELPAGAGPADHAAAVAALSAREPIGKRLDALHRLAARARVPLVARLMRPADAGKPALAALP